MKKFLIVLFLLLAAGGTVFYLGWIQMDIPPNTLGLVFTKTGGWDSSPTLPGRFAWRWEKLAPGNLTLHIYPLTTYTAEFSVDGTLPSGEVYALFLDGRPSFRYELGVQVSYRIQPERIPLLASRDGLLPEGLTAFTDGLRTGMAAAAGEALQQAFSAGVPLDAAFPTSLLQEGILTRYGFLELTALNVTVKTLPDPALYRRAREQYFAALEARREAAAELSRNLAMENIRDEREMERLKKYGDLLSRYPGLIDFIAIEKLAPGDFSDLERLRRRGAGDR